jgi:transposase
MEEKMGSLEGKEPISSSEGEKSFRLKEEAMIREGEFEAIQALKRQGLKKKKAAEILGLDRRTVRRYWKRVKWERKAGMKRPSVLDSFRERLVTRAPDTDYCAQVMFLEIQRMGYTGCYEQVKRFVRPLREERRRFEEATIRFETGPAKQAQVDWGSTWIELAGERVKIHLFVKVLGYSRRIYARAEEDEKLATFLACHERSFRWFEGLTLSILYDNPKTVCLTRDFEGKDIGWNPQFLDFTRYWGFTPKLCKPYRARTKGKVESGVKYVKRNFFALYGRKFHSFEELNGKLEAWSLEIADERIHGTTHEKPSVRFESEGLLSSEGRAPYRIETEITRIIPSDALVVYKTNRYSVPWPLVGKEAVIEEAGERLKIYVEGRLAADHPLLGGRYQQNVIPGHYEGILRPKPASKPRVFSSVSLWAQADQEVEVRDLASYEALLGLPADLSAGDPVAEASAPEAHPPLAEVAGGVQ